MVRKHSRLGFYNPGGGWDGERSARRAGVALAAPGAALGAGVLYALRGIGPLTVAFGCATLVMVASQATRIDFLVVVGTLFEHIMP